MKTDLNHPKANVHSIILGGGSGTRLWPISRKSFPKQFLSLGSSKKSMLQQSVERIRHISKPENRWLVTLKDQETLCRKELGKTVENYLVEPVGRNTAPAVALAAWELLKKDPNSVMVILSADHSIQNTRAFENSIRDAICLAEQNHFVTVGVHPTTPATGFGYIEVGLPLDHDGQIISPQKLTEKNPTGYSVRSFREKPNRSAAEQFIRTGKYLWNAGIFVWKTKTFWDAFSHIQPEMAAAIQNLTPENFQKNYAQIENTSIDIAFLEQTSHVACVPATFDWDDVGSWSAVRECSEQDLAGNSLSGSVFALDTKNSVIHSTKPFIAVIGMENVAVIATEDAILVTPLERCQEVKKIVAHLEKHDEKLL